MKSPGFFTLGYFFTPFEARLLLHMLLKPIANLAQQMIAGIATRDTMVTVGIPDFLEVLVCLNQ